MVDRDTYFESPQQAVEQITEMLLNENWGKLSGYYELSDSNIQTEEFLSGRFFIRTDPPEVAHPAGFWKYRHPFAPGFTFDYTTSKENIITVHLSIEIDQGNGRVQRGMDTFELKHYPGNGYKIILSGFD